MELPLLQATGGYIRLNLKYKKNMISILNEPCNKLTVSQCKSLFWIFTLLANGWLFYQSWNNSLKVYWHKSILVRFKFLSG